MNEHISAEQMSDILLGESNAEAALHLRQCATCQAELAGLRSALGEFQAAAVSWSEAAALRPVPTPQTGRVIAAPAWALTAAVLVLAVVLPLMRPRPAAAPAPTVAQLSSDNALLAQISNEIGETVPAPLQPLAVNP